VTIIPPGYADISLELRLATMARSAFITFGVSCSGVPADQVAQEAMEPWFLPGSSMNSQLDNGVVVVGCTARVGQDGGEALVSYAESGATGGATLTSLPANCAVLIHKRTARGGRRGRGRIFLPWTIGETFEESGLLNSATKTTLQTAANVWLANLSANSVPMVLLHSASAPGVDEPTTPGSPNAVTSLIVDSLIGSQRRRLGRR
jgi:hypothetical protein